MNDRRIAILTLLALAAAAPAAERGIGVRVEVPPTEFDSTADGPNGRFTGSGSFDSRVGVAVLASHSLAEPYASHGFLIGGGPAVLVGMVDGGRIYQGEARGLVGWECGEARPWTLAVELHAGAGMGWIDMPGDTALGTYTAYGLHAWVGPEARVAYRLRGAGRLALSVGWREERMRFDDSDTQVDISPGGVVGGMTFELPLEP